MKVAKDNAFYSKVVKVTYGYLGPAAERFVARQIRNHLDKEPERLERQELAGLIDWFSMAMAVCSEDEQVVQRYAADLRVLTKL
jgi:hypothetical protein